jgi:hypothetical protein
MHQSFGCTWGPAVRVGKPVQQNGRSGAARAARRPTETCRQIGGSARVSLTFLPFSVILTIDSSSRLDPHCGAGATGPLEAPWAAGQGAADSSTPARHARVTAELARVMPQARTSVRRGSPVFAAHPEQRTRNPAQRAGRPSNFSILRRSRLVGRPAPRSRTATGTASSRGGGGGLLSM